MCNCLERRNLELRDANRRIAHVNDAAGNQRPVIETCAIRERDPVKRRLLIALHCPWCGEPYREPTQKELFS